MVRDPHCEFLHLLEGPGRLSGSRVAFLTNDLIGSIIVVFVGAAILVCVTRLVTARKYAPDSPAPAHLHRAGFLPVQWGELRVGYATQICGGISFRTILSLVDVVN